MICVCVVYFQQQDFEGRKRIKSYTCTRHDHHFSGYNYILNIMTKQVNVNNNNNNNKQEQNFQ